MKSGVPQGAVLSGLLFSLFINDLSKVFKTCSVSLYADDAKLYAPVLNSSSVQDVQNDINSLVKWCKDWRLNLNPDKCFFIQYNPKSVSNTVE